MTTETMIGVTGHQGLTVETESKARAEIDEILKSHDGIVGVTSLAEGADQVFAQAILDRAGQLEVVIPCDGYETTFDNAEDRRRFQHLKSMARAVTHLDFDEPSEEAFMAAGRFVVDRSEIVIAVWNGRAAAGLGGTGDVVEYAKGKSKIVHVVWPEGAARRD